MVTVPSTTGTSAGPMTGSVAPAAVTEAETVPAGTYRGPALSGFSSDSITLASPA